MRKCKNAFNKYIKMQKFRHEVPVLQNRYNKILENLSSKVQNGNKIKVLFLVNDVSKWKCQTVFDNMVESNVFIPSILITYVGAEKNDLIENYEKKSSYFTQRKMTVFNSWSQAEKRFIPLQEFSPDIVFFPQPWGLKEDLYNNPSEVSNYALTCYVPYYVPNYGDCNIDVGSRFHRTLWRYFALNETWANEFKNYLNRKEYVGEILGLGHPALDGLELQIDNGGEVVIYAPHWSIDHPKNPNGANFSTFLKNGKMILDFAQKHSEIKWAFKPHPVLRNALLQSGAMTQQEINDYYAAWEKIGISCYDADYVKLFLNSRAMITDCASFLTEYGCTGKPIIHLISSTRKIEPLYPNQELFNSYYKARNESELFNLLENVIINNRDEKRKERLEVLSKSGLSGNMAGKKIVKYLENIIKD